MDRIWFAFFPLHESHTRASAPIKMVQSTGHRVLAAAAAHYKQIYNPCLNSGDNVIQTHILQSWIQYHCIAVS